MKRIKLTALRRKIDLSKHDWVDRHKQIDKWEKILNFPITCLVFLRLVKPHINWSEEDMLENHFEDEPVYWAELHGIDDLGREYSAVGEFCGHPQTHSELINVEEIERI
jgi:hypothetical protein